jgi:hypothetical protein
VPNPKYKDHRVKCNACIKSTKSAEVKLKCIEYLGGKCVDCGYSDHPVAFDFDHIDPDDKSFKISGKAIYRWKELRNELDKCALRCSNCHRIRHYEMDVKQ